MTTLDKNDRAAIEELLPWHAAGTLSVEEAQRVEAMIESDPELAHRYALVREELAETVMLNESLGAPSARAQQRLFAAIDSESPSRRSVQQSLFGGISAGWKNFVASLTPRTLAWSSMAAALLILVQAGVITGGLMRHQPSAGFETASATDDAGANRAEALVRFAPQATAADIAAFLERNNVSIVAGPAAGGLFRLRLPVDAGDTVKAAQLLTTIQQGGPIIFAVPAGKPAGQ
jgi:anti-sigma factor RsiW